MTIKDRLFSTNGTDRLKMPLQYVSHSINKPLFRCKNASTCFQQTGKRIRNQYSAGQINLLINPTAQIDNDLLPKKEQIVRTPLGWERFKLK